MSGSTSNANSNANAWTPWAAGAAVLQRFNEDRWVLFTAILLLNALFRPYTGVVHDARLYGVQVLNHALPGHYADDLYLRYGSQDRYSVFSTLAAPVVEVLGVPPGFFLLYLLSNTIFLFALQQFVRAVMKPGSLATLALIYLAVNPLPYAGLSVFHVHESFLTPRLLAVGLVLLGLERMLRGRTWFSLLLLLAALAVHPIMAFGGLLVWTYCSAVARLGARKALLLAIAGGAAATVTLIHFPLGTALFGHMDEVWRRAAHTVNPYCLPAEWAFEDWLRIAVAFAVVATSRCCAATSDAHRRFLDAIIAVAAVGLVAGGVVPHLPYALLFQGQPWRAVWLLQLLQVPLVFALLGRCCAPDATRVGIAAWLPIAAFAYASLAGGQFPLAAVGLAMLYVWARRADAGRTPGRGAMLCTAALVAAMVLPAVASAAYCCQQLSASLLPKDRLPFFLITIGPFVAWLGAIGVLTVLDRLAAGGRFVCAAVVGSLAMQLAFFALASSPLEELTGRQRANDVAFVRQALEDGAARASGVPTVYWPVAHLEEIWFSLGAKSYFETEQVCGNMFSRATALEGARRADVVKKFDLFAWQRYRFSVAAWKRNSFPQIYGADVDKADPTLEDLYRLCCDDCVDLAVLPHKFDGLYRFTNGRWFIYECRKIRPVIAKKLGRRHVPVDVGNPRLGKRPSRFAGTGYSEHSGIPPGTAKQNQPNATGARRRAP